MNELKTVNCEQLMTTPLKPIEKLDCTYSFSIDKVNIPSREAKAQRLDFF